MVFPFPLFMHSIWQRGATALQQVMQKEFGKQKR